MGVEYAFRKLFFASVFSLAATDMQRTTSVSKSSAQQQRPGYHPSMRLPLLISLIAAPALVGPLAYATYRAACFSLVIACYTRAGFRWGQVLLHRLLPATLHLSHSTLDLLLSSSCKFHEIRGLNDEGLLHKDGGLGNLELWSNSGVVNGHPSFFWSLLYGRPGQMYY